MSEIKSGVRVVTDLAIEMRDSIIELAGERPWGVGRMRWLEGTMKLTGLTFRSTKSMFYEEEHEPAASKVERVRLAIAKKKADAAKRQKDTEEAARVEFQHTVQRLGILVDRLASIDPDFYGEALCALRRAAPMASGKDRALDDRSD